MNELATDNEKRIADVGLKLQDIEQALALAKESFRRGVRIDTATFSLIRDRVFALESLLHKLYYKPTKGMIEEQLESVEQALTSTHLTTRKDTLQQFVDEQIDKWVKDGTIDPQILSDEEDPVTLQLEYNYTDECYFGGSRDFKLPRHIAEDDDLLIRLRDAIEEEGTYEFVDAECHDSTNKESETGIRRCYG